MDDDKIESFFRAMKAADEQLAVPPFPKQKEPRKLLPVFLYAAAAAIAILITVRYVAPSTAGKPAPVVEIDVIVGQDPLTSQSLLENGEKDLSTWKSPTDFLSEYY